MENIPGAKINFDDYDDLKDAITKEFFIMLGAGFSKQIGYFLWDELIDKMIEKYWQYKLANMYLKKFTYTDKENLKKYTNKKYILDMLLFLDESSFEKAVREIFSEVKDKKIKIIEIFDSLKKYPDIKFITKNIDKEFQDIMQMQENDCSIYPQLDSGKKLSYLHGRIDQNYKDWVLTESQYLDAYISKEIIQKYLLEVFKNYTVIFIGCGLQDYEILQLVSKTRNPNNKIKHFSFVEWYELKNKNVLIEKDICSKNYGIKYITYNIDERGYDTLVGNLSEFISMIEKERVRRKLPAEIIPEVKKKLTGD